MNCSRTACKAPLPPERRRVHIFNEPSTTKGYREYCADCGQKIVAVNPDIKFEIIDP